MEAELRRIPLADLVPSKLNPRSTFDPAALEELAASIREKGVLEPIIVRANGKKASYEIVAGERRFKASKLAEQKDIPAIVRKLTDQEALEFSVIENLQRADIHFLDEARGYARLLEGGMTPDALAERVGKPKVYIYQRVALNRLVPKLAKLAKAGRIGLYAA